MTKITLFEREYDVDVNLGLLEDFETEFGVSLFYLDIEGTALQKHIWWILRNAAVNSDPTCAKFLDATYPKANIHEFPKMVAEYRMLMEAQAEDADDVGNLTKDTGKKTATRGRPKKAST